MRHLPRLSGAQLEYSCFTMSKKTSNDQVKRLTLQRPRRSNLFAILSHVTMLSCQAAMHSLPKDKNMQCKLITKGFDYGHFLSFAQINYFIKRHHPNPNNAKYGFLYTRNICFAIV
jgi:hypothetical protein